MCDSWVRNSFQRKERPSSEHRLAASWGVRVFRGTSWSDARKRACAKLIVIRIRSAVARDWFSGVDDRAEAEMASYIYRHFPQTIYASLVFDELGERGRVWCARRPPSWQAMETIRLLESPLRDLNLRKRQCHEYPPVFVSNPAFHRQIQTFGEEGQARMQAATITVIGAGGLGSVVIEGLARLGFVAINIVEPDYAEVTNLNRVVGMRFNDAVLGRPKVEIAARTVEEINPKAIVSIYRSSVFDPSVLTALKQSDLIVVATDSHSSRMFCQRVAAQYLLPLLHVGVNIEAERGQLVDVSGEYALALPGPGGWCLSCAAAFDSQQASWELAPAIDQARWVERGYVRGAKVAAPSVRHLNGVVADLALAEIHNLFSPYREPRTYVAYDGLRLEITSINIGRDPRCAICSPDGVLAMGDLESLPEFNQRREFTFPEPPVDHKRYDECNQREIAGYLGYAPRK